MQVRTRGRRIAIGTTIAILGAALFVWQVRRVGLAEIRDGLAQVGWGFLVILALSFARFVLRALAWTTLIGDGVPLSSALAATIAGDAMGNVTPLSLLVSEPAKSAYLRRHVSIAKSFAALTAETFFYSVSVAMFIIVGTVAMLEAFAVRPELRFAGLLAIASMTAVLAAALWVVWREPALVSTIVIRLPGLPMRGFVERVREFEMKVYAFARQTHDRLAVVVACETAFHLVSFAESYYTLWLITGRSAPLAAFVLDTFNRIVNIVFRAVPMKAGVDEYSTAIVAPAVGFTQAIGVTLALVRKGRMLVWAGIGMLLAVRRGLTVQEVANTGHDAG